jgi:hypothetical protein
LQTVKFAAELLEESWRGGDIKSFLQRHSLVHISCLDLETHEGSAHSPLHPWPLMDCFSLQLFGWQTFKRIGASLSINRCYKIVLTLSITIQLSLFFMFISVSLWLDQLFNGLIRQSASFPVLNKVTSFVTLVVCSFLTQQVMTADVLRSC